MPTVNTSGSGTTLTTAMSSDQPKSQVLVRYLASLSPEYGCDLNQMPIFEVMMRLKQKDRDGLENILFGIWEPFDE